MFSKVIEFINAFDLDYNPLKDKKYWGARMHVLMNNFVSMMQTMNEKKATYVKAYPDKVSKVERRINNRMIVYPSQYTLQKREGYIVV